MTELQFADQAERDNLTAFVARAVRLDQQAPVRLRARGDGVVDAWTATPFDALATRAIRAELTPADVTASGNELLAALTVVRSDVVDPGPSRDLLWRSELPMGGDWTLIDDVPVSVVTELTDRGLEVAKENPGPQGTPPASLLEQPVLTVSGGDVDLKVQLRCLFAMAGMGFTGTVDPESSDVVRVSATDSWLRLDARYGAVLRRRHALLPLLF